MIAETNYFFFNSVYSANDNYDKEKEEYYGLTINSNGNIGWFYPTIFKSSCTIDVTYFPFDDQVSRYMPNSIELSMPLILFS